MLGFVRVQVILPSSDSCHSNIGKTFIGLYKYPQQIYGSHQSEAPQYVSLQPLSYHSLLQQSNSFGSVFDSSF